MRRMIGKDKRRGKAMRRMKTHSEDVLEDFTEPTSDEKHLRGNILVTSDLRKGVKHSLGRFAPEQPGQTAKRTLNVHSTLLITTLSVRLRLLVLFLPPPQRHPLQHLPSFLESIQRRWCV